VDPGDGGGGVPGDGQVPLGGGGGGGGCFIATAAFGTAQEEHVVALRAFRDRYMLTNAAGTWLVRQYYRFSPPLAEFVARNEAVRSIVRHTLRPVTVVARLCVGASAVQKLAIVLVAALLCATLASARRRWRLAHVRRSN
jgi:hypothetical protein